MRIEGRGGEVDLWIGGIWSIRRGGEGGGRMDGGRVRVTSSVDALWPSAPPCLLLWWVVVRLFVGGGREGAA